MTKTKMDLERYVLLVQVLEHYSYMHTTNIHVNVHVHVHTLALLCDREMALLQHMHKVIINYLFV